MNFLKHVYLIIALTLASVSISARQHIIHPAVGEQAPEITLTGLDGETKKLSDLRGKVVFIDFWASWCRTCRIENNTLRSAYSKYKDQSFSIGEGFEVYSVSLDTDSTVWRKAIENDRLYWTNHVSDFKKWKSPLVASYNFKYLPHNLLIDKNGKIVEKGLFGKKIEDTLHSYLAD